MAVIDRGSVGIALVIGADDRLLGTVTDGDIRRALLNGTRLDEPVRRLLDGRANSPYPRTITASPSTPPAARLAILQENRIRHLPIVDSNGRLVDLSVLDELAAPADSAVRAVILAGGLGTRLGPLTAATPKPMLPVGARPVLEWTVEQLRDAGIRKVHVATHYLAEQITEHFGSGGQFGVQIDYTTETEPLGTAGPIRLLADSAEPILVINGDIVTRVDLRALVDFHREQGAEMTVGVRAYEIQVPYGVVECAGPRVERFREKPTLPVLVNAGVYLLEPAAASLIPAGCRFDMTDLIERLLAAGRAVVSFPIVEYWIDIGAPADYARADADARAGLLGAKG